jgi:hypothetical protein
VARRNGNHLSRHDYAQIDTLERQSHALSKRLPESRAADHNRRRHTDAQRALFARGRAIFNHKQAGPLATARAGLAALTDPSLPPHLHRQINALIADIDGHTVQMSAFNPADGIPDAMLRLLPIAEKNDLRNRSKHRQFSKI